MNHSAAKPLLVPLTSSLYVPGKLASSDNVLVDVGARYFVEKVSNAVFQLGVIQVTD